MSKKAVLAFGIIGLLASASAAFAQTTDTAPAPGTAAQPVVLQVNKSGGVLLRGTVSSVASDSVTVKSWGGDWTVNVSSAASVLPRGAALSSFQAGDFVGVQGTVNGSAGWTVDATLIRDWTARQALNQQIKTNVQAVHTTMANGPRTIQGTLSALDAAAQTFTLTNSTGTAYSVSLASGAKLLAQNWATLDFSKVQNGDTVRVYGTVSSSAITASIFRDVSVK
ncbi:MAG: hypothetical protein KGI41_03490 [Patescibacteria group bacterium]|nr:hypothetical protein [Patescibacteria group bacterium]MDE1966274.1 hypothetical protein [Patescibacteria group bacterium]